MRTRFGTRRTGFAVLGSVTKWWRKRQREKKRLALLALVRKVREEQGDYDRDYSGFRPCPSKKSAPAKSVDKVRRLSRPKT